MHILVLGLVWIFSSVSSIPTLRSSSTCSVQPCTHSSLLNCASNEGVCFEFQTNNGTNFCAPASSCELLDRCDQNGYCSSNKSICIINSCCIQPVCLPLILVDLCSPSQQINLYTTASRLSTTTSLSINISAQTSTEYESTTEDFLTTESSFQYKEKSFEELKPSSAIFHPKICPKAYWNFTGIIVASFSDIFPKDFFINQYNEIYIPDNKNHLIRKYFPGNDSLWTTVIESNFLNEPTAIFVDLNENIYIWDSKNHRVINNSQTILSFDQCKSSVDFNQICFANSLFVDLNNSIFISESTKNYSYANRVMKFEVNNTIGRVIAGTYTFGSGIKQLNSPGKIFVDTNGILYVADIDNSRIQKFTPGNRNGTTILSMNGLTDFIMDEDKNIFVMIKSENIVKRIEKDNSGNNIIEFLNQPIRIHFGIDGSIYILNQGTNNILKFQIIDNIC